MDASNVAAKNKKKNSNTCLSIYLKHIKVFRVQPSFL